MMNEMDIKKKVDLVFEETELMSIPVEVVMMANYYGFEVYELDMDDSTSGLIIVDEKPIKNFDSNKIIVVNSNHSNARKRFTIAHELGHFILDNKPSKCYAHRDSTGVYNTRERDANSFASALLMPENDVKKFVNSLTENTEFSIPDFILIDKISKRYNVSIQAAEVRLNKLNLI